MTKNTTAKRSIAARKLPPARKFTDVQQRDYDQMWPATGLWPYCSRSGLIPFDLAQSIRTWALAETAGRPAIMTEAELNAHSQRQLLSRYLNEHLRPTITKVAPWTADLLEDEPR
jgi:hypothetical protein